MSRTDSDATATSNVLAETNAPLTRKDVQDFCGISKPTLNRWIRARKFPAPLANWPGRAPRWSRMEVLNWLAALSPPPTRAPESTAISA